MIRISPFSPFLNFREKTKHHRCYSYSNTHATYFFAKIQFKNHYSKLYPFHKPCELGNLHFQITFALTRSIFLASPRLPDIA